jgi:hypothetical protein
LTNNRTRHANVYLVVELAAAAVVVAGLPLAVSAAAAEPVELVEKMPVIVVTGLVLQMSAAAAAAAVAAAT